jgi:uncharacterized membrane protein
MANSALTRVAAQPELDRVAKPIGDAVVAAYRNAGDVGMAVKNAFHGVWLEHPLHPALTSIPLGAWTTTVALDAKAAVSGDESYSRAADFALGVGLVGAVGSAVTGLTDWSETDGRAKRIGLVHGLLNVAATAMMATAYVLRRRNDRRAGQACTLAGVAVATVSGYLGGDWCSASGSVSRTPSPTRPSISRPCLPVPPCPRVRWRGFATICSSSGNTAACARSPINARTSAVRSPKERSRTERSSALGMGRNSGSSTAPS